MKKIWEKNNSNSCKSLVDTYCFLEGVAYDNQLVLFDILGSIAHMNMLYDIGVLSKKEINSLTKGLKEIIHLNNQGKYIVTPEDEDIHTKVEAYLTSTIGEAGQKIHTGRSRNDQIATDMRLYAKDKMITLALQTVKTALAMISFAKQYEFVPMPGHTHMQKAMPSSVGLWGMSFVESLVDDIHQLKAAYEINDQSPLGSGAAFGVSLPINRETTAHHLGFSSVLNNSLYCQASRPKVQLSLMQAFTQVMITASKFASDLLLYTTTEFNYFTVDESICTGSSIMPQKKNLDVLEYMRAKAHTVIALQQMVASISSGLPSGYNADFGQTKKPFMESIDIVFQTLKVIEMIIIQTQPNVEILKSSCTKELYATHAAFERVKSGISFREAYKTVGLNLHALIDYDPIEVIKQTNHIGGPGKLEILKKEKQIYATKSWWESEQKKYNAVINTLLQRK